MPTYLDLSALATKNLFSIPSFSSTFADAGFQAPSSPGGITAQGIVQDESGNVTHVQLSQSGLTQTVIAKPVVAAEGGVLTPLSYFGGDARLRTTEDIFNAELRRVSTQPDFGTLYNGVDFFGILKPGSGVQLAKARGVAPLSSAGAFGSESITGIHSAVPPAGGSFVNELVDLAKTAGGLLFIATLLFVAGVALNRKIKARI